uniref:Putative alpha/beta hydrolase n=1 Tax=Cladonia uncialis subsp. uncialis TaxID=180999 RepID=A0A2K9YDR8_CLAUC|nr:putative alpha/beta hydrolase [Cladonia uncialis subsp. uncialis]
MSLLKPKGMLRYPCIEDDGVQTVKDFHEVTEGRIFWRSDSPIIRKHSVKDESILKPTLLFIHACVADHTLWDDQVAYFTNKGWCCLRYDLLGYGESIPSESYLSKESRSPVKHHDHTARIAEAFLASDGERRQSSNGKFVVIGLSCGACIAIDFAISSPELVSGLVLCAGGVGGLDIANTADEDALFRTVDQYMAEKDIENAARTNVRIWGDGPQEDEGRLDANVRGKLYNWCKTIATREIARNGGSAIPQEDLNNPPAAQRLSQIKVGTIVAKGKYDESSTVSAMDYVAQNIERAELKEFEAGHMINLECPTEFNNWLGIFLDKFLH